MNDEFLYQLRRPPRPEFAEALYKKISENVLSQVDKTRPSFWRRWSPRLAAAAILVAVVIATSLLLPKRESTHTVSAAEIIERTQAATDDYTELSGVLHWETVIEEWWPGSDETFYRETEIWFDFDNPGRHHFHWKSGSHSYGEYASGSVCDGIAYHWYYGSGRGVAPYVDEIVLSPEEMQEMAALYTIPFPFHDDLADFADILPDVKVVGETTVVGRRAYLLRGLLLAQEWEWGGMPRSITSTVTLTVDSETYWVLGREEMVAGEQRPRTVYRTQYFELLSQDQVIGDTFIFTPPEDVQVRRLEGLDALVQEPRAPTMSLEEAADAATFIFLVPTTLPDDLKRMLYVSKHQMNVGQEPPNYEYVLMYQGIRGMQISQSLQPLPLTGAARLVDIGGRQGWLKYDLRDSRLFAIFLPDWEVGKQGISQEPDDKEPPGLVILWGQGLSVDEAIAVLESLEPYEP